MNDWIRDSLRERGDRRRAMEERFFPPELAEPAKAPGDADAGKGDAGRPAVYEDTPHGRMRIFTDAELTSNESEHE